MTHCFGVFYLEIFAIRRGSINLAQRDPTNAKNINNTLALKRTYETKDHYIGSFRQFVFYCVITIREYPFDFPIDHDVVMFWLADRVACMGNIKSIGRWISMLLWLHEIYGIHPTFANNLDYIAYRIALNKQYAIAVDPRLPFTLPMIVNYTKSLGVSVQTRATVPLDNLLKALQAQAHFLTMARSGEIDTPSKKNSIRKGLIFKDFVPQSGHGMKYIMASIINHKTRNTTMKPKKMYFTDTSCNNINNCVCNFINPYKLASAYVQRRKMVQNLFNSTKVFVWSTGKPFKVCHLTKIAHDIAIVNDVPQDEIARYTAYSFRSLVTVYLLFVFFFK